MKKAARHYDPQEVSQLAGRLSTTASKITSNDLSSMAQMHGWCEQLVEAVGKESPHPLPAVSERVAKLAQQLEGLILGEETNVDVVFKNMIESVSELAATITAEIGTPCEPVTADPSGGSAPADNAAPAPAEPAAETAPPTVTEDTAPVAEGTAPVSEAAPSANTAAPAKPPEAYVSEPLRLNPNETDFVKGFVEEAAEHLEAVEAALLEVERAPDDAEKINDLFRPFHTIKGMAGFLNLRDVASLTHEAETLLDQGRKGKRDVTAGLIDLIFDVADILKSQVAAIGAHLADPQGDTVRQPPVAEMIDKLREVVAGRIDLDSDEEPSKPVPGRLVGENLVAAGTVSPQEVEKALDIQKDKPDKKVGQILVDMGAATPKQVGKALRAQSQAAPAGGAGASNVTDLSVRIDTAKLDALVDMVGELVIAQTLVNASRLVVEDPRLTKNVSQVTKIVRNVQEMAMSMRMVQIGGTFQKMARLVRDVSRKAGKHVELTIAGEDTELDKNVIQQISDPLVHMVRNAIDHGIESPDARKAAGKEPVGRVHLAAYHQGGNIVIEIRDDGKGLDPKVLIAKAIEKGIVQPGEELTDQQAFALIFAAGFSTAAQVTDISGRGVGMDVVRRNIDALRGRVEITSEKGKGSTFYIRLPLTLAIIDGMVVGIEQERFIIPTIAIEQALRPVPTQIHTVQHRGEMIQVRGTLIPLIQLGRLFGLTGRINPCENMVVICNCDGRSVGIVVEDLLGQQQVVIKTLGERFHGLKGVAGAAILGDGRVGLILEPSGLAAAHSTCKVDLADADTRGSSQADQTENVNEKELVEACAS